MSNSNGSPRAVIVAIVALAAVALVAYNFGNAQGAAASSTAPIRGFYLTKNTVTGGNVLTACAAGYHFASIWEIENTSDLHYNRTLGLTNTNSGLGAPSISYTLDRSVRNAPIGWIRTGGALDTNCKNWTSNSAADHGSAAGLTTANTSSPIWQIFSTSTGSTQVSCDGNVNTGVTVGVWCVQN
jgi:hypothetical protein